MIIIYDIYKLIKTLRAPDGNSDNNKEIVTKNKNSKKKKESRFKK